MIGECTTLSTPFHLICNIYVDNQAHATEVFKDAMAKLQVLGQDTSTLTDCSEVRSFVYTRIRVLS